MPSPSLLLPLCPARGSGKTAKLQKEETRPWTGEGTTSPLAYSPSGRETHPVVTKEQVQQAAKSVTSSHALVMTVPDGM